MLAFLLQLSIPITAKAQAFVELSQHKLLSNRSYSIYISESIYLTCKNGTKYKAKKLSALTDSCLVLDNDSIILFSEIAKLKLSANRPLCTFARRYLVRFGILFVTLNTVNQAIVGDKPILQPAAFLIGGGIVALGMAFRPFEYHHIRTNKRTAYRFVDPSYTKYSENPGNKIKN